MNKERIKQELWKLYVDFLEEAKKKLERDGHLAPVIFGLTSTERVIALSTEEETFLEYAEIGETLRRRHNIVGAVSFKGGSRTLSFESPSSVRQSVWEICFHNDFPQTTPAAQISFGSGMEPLAGSRDAAWLWRRDLIPCFFRRILQAEL